MKETFKDFCPVPAEQQPVNEYEQLRESWLFCWPTLDLVSYGRKLTWVCLWLGVIVAPIAAYSFPPTKRPFLFLLSTLQGTSLLLALVILRLYLGWFYISDRLKSEQVSYEESGWYDGQIWPKTPEVLTRDHLIFAYQVEPILKRLQYTALFLGSLIAGAGFLWFFLDKI